MIKLMRFKKGIKPKRNVACIGYFDGVHLGHQQLIKRTVELAEKKGLIPYLISFEPDPYDVINGKNSEHLNDLDSRIALFEKFGIKGVILIPFDEEMMKKSPVSFYEDVLSKLNIDTLTCGQDFNFAHLGKGRPSDLKKMGMKVEVVEELKYYGKKISSTRIREALKKGKVSLANRMLGYEYKKQGSL